MPLLSIAFSLFIITNAIGNSPTILALIKDFPIERQRRILLRECTLAIFLSFGFLFLGDYFLNLLKVKDYAVNCAGGILLFLVALQMIFPKNSNDIEEAHLKHEPFLVPIATPLLAGGGLMASILYFSRLEPDLLKMFFAVLISGLASTAIMLISPQCQKVLGKRGMIVLEQLMGMVLAMLSMDMIVKGVILFRAQLEALTS